MHARGMRFMVLFFACMVIFSAACSGSIEPPDPGGTSASASSVHSSRSSTSSRSSSVSAQSSLSSSSVSFQGTLYYSTTSSARLYVHDRNSILRIGSMNGQILGPTKLGRPETLSLMASVATNFDILALQEVGNNGTPSDTTASNAMVAYVACVNELPGVGAGTYNYVRGHQFAFVYRQDSVTISDPWLYVDTNLITYSPLLAKATTPSGLSFVIMTAHTSPTKAKNEIPVIPQILNEAAARYGETRTMCLGDYNADTTYYSPGSAAQGWLNAFTPPNWYTVIRNGITTNVGGGKTYDRIQLSMPLAEYYTGTWGVLKYAEYYDVTVCEGPESSVGTENAVSDHYTVWAEFRLAESP